MPEDAAPTSSPHVRPARRANTYAFAAVALLHAKIPRRIDIQMTSCGQPNAFYDPNKVRVIICYELVV